MYGVTVVISAPDIIIAMKIVRQWVSVVTSCLMLFADTFNIWLGPAFARAYALAHNALAELMESHPRNAAKFRLFTPFLPIFFFFVHYCRVIWLGTMYMRLFAGPMSVYAMLRGECSVACSPCCVGVLPPRSCLPFRRVISPSTTSSTLVYFQRRRL
uniref:Uncharacterized protein TCIL3000_11_2030 n=1 Tax=Trypanosoma congolense (strain IL3000) TaxID=1068625 RepID=G0UZJ6_TRYCI|nr:unnamed protein product [Trypanosoma congolense IL3000]